MIVYLQMIDTSEDRSKFEQLYLEYRGLMFHAANQILHNEQDAEDAVHQAFLSIAQHIQNIDQPISSKTRCYVVTITENKAIDQYRRRQKQTITDTTSMMAYTDSDGRMISLIYSRGADATSLFLLPQDAEMQTVSVNGQDADFYLESDPESANALVWLSASGDTIYCLTAPLPASTLIQIAESIPT